MILRFIFLIFPKYIAILENVKIEDHCSNPGNTSDRFIDIALLEANGNLDVIEIKRPFDDVLLSKTVYRDNFVPTKDLSGTIMQAEKYLFHLSKWGVSGEDKLTKDTAGNCCLGCLSGSPIPNRCSFWAAIENLMATWPSTSVKRST